MLKKTHFKKIQKKKIKKILKLKWIKITLNKSII